MLAALSASFGLAPLAQGGILDILRGEPVVEWQRVAFVGSAEVKQVTGPAERLIGIDKWEPLQEGTLLTPGDVIRSQPGGAIVLEMLESNSLVKVTPATILRLAPLEQDWARAALTGKEERRGFSVRALRGRAFFRAAGSAWRPVTVNTVLAPSTIIRTEANAALDLFDNREGRFVRIAGGAQAELTETLTLARHYTAPAIASAAPVVGR